jgi:hypothetical protein
MRVVRVGALPDGALEAAAEFYAKVVGGLNPPRAGEDLVLVFSLAPYDHRGWRLAALQDLARAAAPARMNGIVGDDEQAIADAVAYLERSPGITGQLLEVVPG